MRHVYILSLLAVIVLLCTIQSSSAALPEAHKRIAEQRKINKRAGAQYLQSKATEAGVISLKSGMLVEILKENTNTDAKSPKDGGNAVIPVTPLNLFVN